MDTTKTFNDLVRCTPFAASGPQSKTTPGGLKFIANYSELVELKVLSDGPQCLLVGDSVFVSGADCRAAWAVKKYMFDDDECIFVPISSILLSRSLVQ